LLTTMQSYHCQCIHTYVQIYILPLLQVYDHIQHAATDAWPTMKTQACSACLLNLPNLPNLLKLPVIDTSYTVHDGSIMNRVEWTI
jgi:hypothetical protein